MNNSDVLEEYKFLYHAIRMICPLVFEPPNAELQTHIVYDDLVKEHATRELAKKWVLFMLGMHIRERERQRTQIKR